ncbi:MAG: leucine-rich repeat domain-containing protein [Treponema sp.]|nr:leucine-rich repeat domain-containing protein [Treponema sp.]
MSDVTSKSGLYYRDNFHTLIGIDIDDNSFTGRVPFGVHTIEDNVFSATPYESYSIPDSVKQVGFNLFENCENAVSIRLPGNLSELTPYMFSGCKRLSKINMPNVVEEFPEGIFMNCASLTEVPFRTDIAYIGAKAFLGCTSLTNVVFPETVQIIEHQAFALCSGIESIVIGSGVSEIADDAFAGCVSLCHIRLAEDNPYFSLNDAGCVVRKADGKTVIFLASSQKTGVNFINEGEPLETDEKLAVWMDSEEEETEEDDTFSAEIGAGDEEAAAMGLEPSVIKESSPVSVVEPEAEPEDMLSSIMNQNSSSSPSEAASSVAISVEELASVVDTMNASNGTYTEDAVEKKAQDRNLSILCENVGYSVVSDFPSKGLPATTSDLYVFAETLVDDANGGKTVTPKLKKCCEALANIHDLKKIIYLAELPVDNDEFLMFLGNTLKRQHVLVACTAASPDRLSEYSKKICQAAQISMDRNEIVDQRKKAGIKNPGTIKLIVQDKL